MPEMNHSRKLERWSLLDAQMAGQLIEVTCQFCNKQHFYWPSDILKIRDNMSLAKLGRLMNCECGRRDYMFVTVRQPYGDDYGKLKVRRLAKVKMVKVPVWEDVIL